MVEQVGRSGETRCHFRQHAVVALPILSDGVPKLVVQLLPAGRKVAELVAARTDVPRLGDQLHAAEDGILPHRVQKTTALIEAVRLARQRGGQVEAERSEEHTSELQSLMRTSYADFCLQTKTTI